MSEITCPNCGNHDLSHSHIGIFEHAECSASETGKTEWQQNVGCIDEPCPCPKCSEPCRPAKLVCPQCNMPMAEAEEN